MRKFPIACALVLLCAASTFAQAGRPYRYDNFDIGTGVQIENVPTTAQLPSNKVRLSAKPVTEAPSTRPKQLIYARPRGTVMMNSKSLDGFTTGDAKVDSFIVE